MNKIINFYQNTVSRKTEGVVKIASKINTPGALLAHQASMVDVRLHLVIEGENIFFWGRLREVALGSCPYTDFVDKHCICKLKVR